jgi:hypothetical protein
MKKCIKSQAVWCTLIIPAPPREEDHSSTVPAKYGQKLPRPYLKNKVKTKGLKVL